MYGCLPGNLSKRQDFDKLALKHVFRQVQPVPIQAVIRTLLANEATCDSNGYHASHLVSMINPSSLCMHAYPITVILIDRWRQEGRMSIRLLSTHTCVGSVKAPF
jgi:hypothetical protein